jgi:hypothetical protein
VYFNKALHNIRQICYWLRTRNDVEKWCRQCDTRASSGVLEAGMGPNTVHRCNFGAPFERISVDVAEPFPRRDLVIGVDCFMKWPEAYVIPN